MSSKTIRIEFHGRCFPQLKIFNRSKLFSAEEPFRSTNTSKAEELLRIHITSAIRSQHLGPLLVKRSTFLRRKHNNDSIEHLTSTTSARCSPDGEIRLERTALRLLQQSDEFRVDYDRLRKRSPKAMRRRPILNEDCAYAVARLAY